MASATKISYFRICGHKQYANCFFFYCLCVFFSDKNVKLHLEVLCQPIRRSQEKYKNSASVLTYRLVCTGQCVLLKWLQLGTLKEEGNRYEKKLMSLSIKDQFNLKKKNQSDTWNKAKLPYCIYNKFLKAFLIILL